MIQTGVSQLHIPGSFKNSGFFKIILIYSEFAYPHNAPAQFRKLLDMTPSLNCGPLRQEWLKNTQHQMGFLMGAISFIQHIGTIRIDFFPLTVRESGFSVGKMACQTQEEESDGNPPLR